MHLFVCVRAVKHACDHKGSPAALSGVMLSLRGLENFSDRAVT